MKEAFLESICREPEDMSLRLVYADWLEENGEIQESSFIRENIERTYQGRIFPNEYPRVSFQYKRGFIEVVECTFRFWYGTTERCEIGEEVLNIVSTYPITYVSFTDKPFQQRWHRDEYYSSLSLASHLPVDVFDWLKDYDNRREGSFVSTGYVAHYSSFRKAEADLSQAAIKWARNLLGWL